MSKPKISEIQEVFKSSNAPDWDFFGSHTIPGDESGQAIVAEVSRKSDSKKGIFRYLKRKTPIDIARFRRELDILKNPKYKHKNIVGILSHGNNDPYWYISEKGEDFRFYWEQVLNQESDPNKLVEMGVEIVLKLLEGLALLHVEKVVHRDIKPGNIIILNSEPVLIDFGLVYEEGEVRISPESSPAGNRGFSPDQMMYHNEEVPPWFDVFMLSQVLIWMIATKPGKPWSRPFDWRFVRYPKDLSDYNRNALIALTSTCSDPDTGPQDATQMTELINNLFILPMQPGYKPDQKVAEIIENIKRGKAKSLALKASGVGSFYTKFPLFEKFVLDTESFLEDFLNNYPDLQIAFSKGRVLSTWADGIKNTTKFLKNESTQTFSLICGEDQGDGSGCFRMNFQFSFQAPGDNSRPPGYSFQGVLPDDLLPFSLRINTSSYSPGFREKNKGEMFYVVMDKLGNLSYFEKEVNSRKPITQDELFEKISNLLTDPETWGLIQ